MPNILVNSGPLAATGVLYSAMVDDIEGITVYVDDNGGGSTITYETAPDNTTWTAFAGGFSFSAAGVPVALGGSTTTAKGRFWFPIDVKYFRARVSTYVSGNVVARVEESVISPRDVVPSLQSNLIGGGVSSQAAATPLFAENNRFGTVALNSGARLPARGAGNIIRVRNSGANPLLVYPPVGGTVNGGAVNAAFSQAVSTTFTYVVDPSDPTSWWPL